MVYAWHGLAEDSPIETIDPSMKVSVLADVQFNTYEEEYDFIATSVKIEKDNGREMMIMREFFDLLDVTCEELEDFLRDKHTKTMREGGYEYSREDDLIDRGAEWQK